MSVRFLQGAEVNACVRIAMALVPRVFVPTELLSGDSMYHNVHRRGSHRARLALGSPPSLGRGPLASPH